MLEFFGKFKKNRIWSIAVYIENRDFSFQKTIKSPALVIDSKKLRRRDGHIHTYADPFLFPFNDELYIFFESQAVGKKSRIEAYKTSDLQKFVPVGEILAEPFDLSFPFVFECNSSVYMLPESHTSDELSLYKFEEFPHKLVRIRVLLRGRFNDSCLIQHNGIWFLFTTKNDTLEIYYTDDIEKGTLIPHSRNPINADPKFSRCGGGIIIFNSEMYRIAQDCSAEYGRNISILRINELSETTYDEEIVIDDYFDLRESWNSRGGHHLSIAQFRGKNIIAVDGKQNDFYINKLLSLVYK